ncbi:cytochrome c oxidase subunit II [Cylindrospermum sp. NIES-4074]|nr:cytochrome c oxidase subunit II [Cylindrospermum sp. NIES-4074]
MTKILNNLLLTAFVTVLIIVSYWIGKQAYLWMPPQATGEARRVDDLFSFLVTVGAFIFLGIVGIIIYSLIFHRAPRGDYSEGHPARGSWQIETLWMAIPTLLVLWIAFQSYRIYQNLNLEGLQLPIAMHMHLAVSTEATIPKPFAQEIGVVAKQWAWSFRYPNNITSNSELHLPVNQNIRLVLQSEDVLHGFYVPEFRIKQDIIPNRTIIFTFTPLRVGKYRLRNSQFSGTNFALMEANVYFEPPETYNQWLAQAANHQLDKPPI